TFTQLTVKSGATTWTNAVGGMVKPGATERFAVGNVPSQPAGPIEVDYTFLDDYGAGVKGTYAPKAPR
ncbi:hypothetical protein NO113_20160, partial [Clostridioides difficile]|uniref:fimbrial biogenesis chaperone n=1 Tax=Clostridioides difficile TaxID=1496 RepID=UPI00210DED54